MQTPDLTLCCQCGVGLLGFSRVQASLPENGEGYPVCPPAWLVAHVFSCLLSLGRLEVGIDERREGRKEVGLRKRDQAGSTYGLRALAMGCAHHLCCVDPV